MSIWRYYRNVCIELTSFKSRFDKKVELIKAAEVLPEKKLRIVKYSIKVDVDEEGRLR